MTFSSGLSRPVRALLLVELAALLAVANGCTPELRYPYPATALLRDSAERGADALVHYLRQAHADPAVCGAEQPAPHLRVMSEDAVAAVLHALEDGEVPVKPAAGCVALAVPRLQGIARGRATWRIAETYLDVLESKSTAEQRAALHDLVLKFVGRGGQADVLQAQLEEALRDADFDAGAEALAREQLVALELGHDRYQGRPVTEPQLRALNDALLPSFATRLADPALKRAARAELIRRRAEASVYAVVREDVAGVVERVLETGRNSLDLGARPIETLWFDAHTPAGVLAVRQNLERREATLLMAAKERREILPSFPLERWLWFRAKGVSPAVTLCGAPERLDTAPCVASKDVTIDATHARVDASGTLRFRDSLAIPELLASLSALQVHAQVGRKRTEQLLPLVFDPPRPLVLTGEGSGATGPTLDVRLREQAGVVVFDVRSADATWVAILDPRVRSTFAIVSRGAQGQTGWSGRDGSNGADGTSGSSASCGIGGSGGDGRDGSSGGNGQDGGDGSPGGAGGDIRVRVACEPLRCGRLLELARALVRSEGGLGGDGGRGGRGGRGGSGGRGGAGTSCQVSDSASGTLTRTEWKSSGRSGSDGSNGWNGSGGDTGRSGDPGRVSFEQAE